VWVSTLEAAEGCRRALGYKPADIGGTNDFYIFSYSNSNVNIFCEVDVR
jgi:hypothetical protein